MERKQAEIILGQANNIISSRVTDIDALLFKPEHSANYKKQTIAMANLMIEIYQEFFKEA